MIFDTEICFYVHFHSEDLHIERDLQNLSHKILVDDVGLADMIPQFRPKMSLSLFCLGSPVRNVHNGQTRPVINVGVVFIIGEQDSYQL